VILCQKSCSATTVTAHCCNFSLKKNRVRANNAIHVLRFIHLIKHIIFFSQFSTEYSEVAEHFPCHVTLWGKIPIIPPTLRTPNRPHTYLGVTRVPPKRKPIEFEFESLLSSPFRIRSSSWKCTEHTAVHPHIAAITRQANKDKRALEMATGLKE
jgi:hypothetical protein